MIECKWCKTAESHKAICLVRCGGREREFAGNRARQSERKAAPATILENLE
jgi:hypothetical protein